ncbi:MAG: UTRA domain-containing protein, partial [Bacillota bacterium]|nr:UTRA domain-containing protein [Bacillota bacterium]
ISIEKYDAIKQEQLKETEIYQVFQDQYHQVLKYGSERIGITTAQSEEAEYLEISDNSPLFFVQKLGKTKEQAVLYSQAVVRPDKIQFASILK